MRHAENSIAGSGAACSTDVTTTATCGQLARGAAAKIAASRARLSARLVFPGVSGLDADDLEFGGQMRAGDTVVRDAGGRGADRGLQRPSLRQPGGPPPEEDPGQHLPDPGPAHELPVAGPHLPRMRVHE